MPHPFLFAHGVKTDLNLIDHRYILLPSRTDNSKVAFIVFSSLKFVLNSLPEAFVKITQVVTSRKDLYIVLTWPFQSLVSLRRIAKYLDSEEISSHLSAQPNSHVIAFEECTVTWPKTQQSQSRTSQGFCLQNLNVEFPIGKLSLICGPVGSGKSLLLLGAQLVSIDT